MCEKNDNETGASDNHLIGDSTEPEAAMGASTITDDTYCWRCGYNLRRLASKICPECALGLEDYQRVESIIPWVHRRDLGRCRAYWQTFRLLTFQSRRLGSEVVRTVSYGDAQSFRWITVAHAFVALIAIVILFYVAYPPAAVLEAHEPLVAFGFLQGDDIPLLLKAYAAVWPIGVMLFCVVLTFAAVTAIPSYFFHPKVLSIRHQNSLISLSYYACAPLAAGAVGLVIPAFICTQGFLLENGLAESPLDVALDTMIGTGAIMGIAMLWSWLVVARLAKRTMPVVKGRTALVSVCVPALCSVVTLLLLIGLPVIILWLVVAIVSVW